MPECVGRHANELFAVNMVRQVRAFTGKAVTPEHVYLAHHAPKLDIAPLARALGTRTITFGAEANGIVYADRVLGLPNASADPPQLSLLDSHAEQRLASGAACADVARAVVMSTRTMQRRIADHGTSYAALVESVRAEMAKRWVESGDRSLAEIAAMLSDAETRPFLRAFKRWTGKTPTAYRTSVS